MTSGPPDYRAIDPDSSKDPEDYSYAERRAELLRAVERVGSPRRLNYAQMGRHYGVSRETIRQDIKRLGEYIDEATDDQVRRLEVESFLWSCARDLQDEGNHRQAAQTLLDLEEWRMETDDLTSLMERVEALEATAGGTASRFRVK